MVDDVAVVVVTYNSAAVVGALLDSLPAALDGLAADVVVVDNGSTDDTCAVLAARSDRRLVTAPNAGYAAGINCGLRHARAADAYLVLNPDVRHGPRIGAGAGRRAGAARRRDRRTAGPRRRREPGPLAAARAHVAAGPRPEPARPARTLRARAGGGRLRAPGTGGLGPRGGARRLDGLRPRGRRVGRVLLPLLRGDRLLPAGRRRRLGHRGSSRRRARCTSAVPRDATTSPTRCRS